jgi:ATP-dependent DNA helicase Rep
VLLTVVFFCDASPQMTPAMNPAQREAVRYLDGPCLVIAGAGSGKTRVITHKMLHLIDQGIEAQAIAAITFTNKAAMEMQDRVKQLVKERSQDSGGKSTGPKPRICTFHSLGVQILRRDAQLLGYKPAFSILDSDDQFGLVQQAMATTDKLLIRQAMTHISLWKNALITPEQAIDVCTNNSEQHAARAYLSYDATLRAYQAVDFDDLIALPVRLFEQHPEALAQWQKNIRYLLVDEYQDTNVCQYTLLKQIVGARAAFTAVGDDDQSIYGWRGATLENLANLGRDFPHLKVVKLEQNYRSSQNILAAANAVIDKNPKLHAKTLWSEHGVGDPVHIFPMNDEEHEAESIGMRLQAHKFERRAKFSDYAILYRSNHQSRAIEQALRKERIPYVVSGGQSFFDRSEIRDLCSYLRLLSNEDDDPAFIRAITTPKRGIGNTTLEHLGRYSGERKVSMFEALFEAGFESRVQARQLESMREFGDFINRIRWRAEREPGAVVLDDMLKAIDYSEHLRQQNDDKTAAMKQTNVTDFVNWLKRRAEDDNKTLLELAQQIALLSQLDNKAEDVDAVRLSTLHAAKGLEYPHVFLIGVEEGLLPHIVQDAPDDEARIQEERRLMYVGITRAQRSLQVTWCKQRKRAGGTLERMPSRFLGEMGSALKTAQQVTDEKPMSPKERLALLQSMLKRQVGFD